MSAAAAIIALALGSWMTAEAIFAHASRRWGMTLVSGMLAVACFVVFRLFLATVAP